MKVEILEIYLSGGHDFKGRWGKERLRNEIASVPSAELVAGRGIVGDRYFGFKDNYKGQVTFIAVECIQELEQELECEVLDWGEFRRNVVIKGVDLNALVGKAFTVDGIRLLGTERCRPCEWMDQAIAPGACDAMENRGGLRCRILSSGELKKGRCELEVEGDGDG